MEAQSTLRSIDPVTPREIECFVSAREIEHSDNPEVISIRNKIRVALVRQHKKCCTPRIAIQHFALNSDDVGYWVWALISCAKDS